MSNRLVGALQSALGPDIARFLEEPGVTDILVNEDRIWIDRLQSGRSDTGASLSPDAADFAIRMLASSVGESVTRERPLLCAQLPGGERVAATIAPITKAPTLAIRIPPKATFNQSDFPIGDAAAENSDIAYSGWDAINRAIVARRNILIAGGTGSGKTSLLSALLKHPSITGDRCLIIEDTPEVQIAAPDHVRFVSSQNVSMQQLVEHSLRYRPDRLIIGEVRKGDVAVSLINALNSGHPGSFCTIHADSPRLAIRRLELLCQQGCGDRQTEAIADAIGLVVFVVKTPTGRAIADIR